MENPEDKKTKEYINEYLKMKGIALPRFCDECSLPNGGKLHFSTLYRQLNNNFVNFSEKIRYAIRSNSDFVNFVKVKEESSKIADVTVVALIKDGIGVPLNPKDPSTLAFEHSKIIKGSHICLDQHGESRDQSLLALKPIMKKTETSPTLCHRKQVYLRVEDDWTAHFPHYLEQVKELIQDKNKLPDRTGRLISNSHLRHHNNFYGFLEFVDGEPDTAFMDDRDYQELTLLLTLMPFNYTIVFPLKAIDFIYRVQYLLEPVFNKQQALIDALRKEETSDAALWVSDVEQQYETFSGIRYAGILDMQSASKEADKVTGIENFNHILDELLANTHYTAKNFFDGLLALKNSEPYVMLDSLAEQISDMNNFLRQHEVDLPKRTIRNIGIKIKHLQKAEEAWDDLLTEWKIAYNSHCQMQLEQGDKWQNKATKIYTSKLREMQQEVRQQRTKQMEEDARLIANEMDYTYSWKGNKAVGGGGGSPCFKIGRAHV